LTVNSYGVKVKNHIFNDIDYSICENINKNIIHVSSSTFKKVLLKLNNTSYIDTIIRLFEKEKEIMKKSKIDTDNQELCKQYLKNLKKTLKNIQLYKSLDNNSEEISEEEQDSRIKQFAKYYISRDFEKMYEKKFHNLFKKHFIQKPIDYNFLEIQEKDIITKINNTSKMILNDKPVDRKFEYLSFKQIEEYIQILLQEKQDIYNNLVLKLNTDLEKFCIHLDPNGQIIFNNHLLKYCSNYEQNVCLMILKNVIAKHCSMTYNLFFIDECFEVFDSNKNEIIKEIIKEIMNNKSCIIVTSHKFDKNYFL